MVRVTEELVLTPDHVNLYQATDPLLGHLPVLIFHGPSTTANYTFNSSRVQVHIYSVAGFQCFPRLTISPNSPFYQVVEHLPREFQVDEVYRALAFALSKYFHELPESVKHYVRLQYPSTRGRRPGSGPELFSEHHAAEIAKAMVKADNTAEAVRKVNAALQPQHITSVDIDLVLPPGAVIPLQAGELEDVSEDEDDIIDPTLRQYGMYTGLVKLFGEPIFLPTSRLRRAPSKPSALNRSKSFSKDQKFELRRFMAELVETEERYVAKLNELVKHMADDYRQRARDKSSDSTSPSEADVDKLFPKSSEQILQLNTAFMQELRKVVDDTEAAALADMESGTTSSRVAGASNPASKGKDASGAAAIAKVMLEWFPRFTDCYQSYIRASQNFPQLISSFTAQQSSFSERVAATGEQQLRSIVVEPVQRLPRYSLLIDQIVGCLPITHPALQPMLKARDIIANICSMDDPLTDKPQVTNRLRNMIQSWAVDLEPKGRLITALDFYEVPAPHEVTDSTYENEKDRAGILLLFSDIIVILKKLTDATMTARDLLREIDKPSAEGLLVSMTHAAGGLGSYELAFAGWHNLNHVRFTESSNGSAIWMTSSQEMQGAHASHFVTSTGMTSRFLVLQESYEGKASKWCEDVVKARIEARFPEAEREDPRWTLRSVRMPDTSFSMYAAVFQEGIDQFVEGRGQIAPIRVVIDNERGTKGAPVGHYGVEMCSEVKTMMDQRKVVVITVGLSGKKSTDEIALEDFLPTLSRRIIQLLGTQFQVSNAALCPALVSYHTKVLRSLSVSSRAEKTRSFLSSSPVKYLSSFLGGNSSSLDLSSAPKLQRAVTDDASLLTAASQLSRQNSTREASSLYGSVKSRDNVRFGAEDDRPENPLIRLEQTFTGYMASLQACKGNIVGRMVLNRSAADELLVNEIYNKLQESPYDIEHSSDAGPDVIFAAFDKFVRIAWKEQMGPIITQKALDALQVRASKQVPGEFSDFVRFLFGEMAPQNRRAFTALIKLLADLLDGCGNDSDRGALTLAFAEILVPDRTAANYINLLDRLVDDCDRIFEDHSANLEALLEKHGLNFDTMTLAPRGGKSHSSSLTSNTSSLRKKFGFDTLLRHNSKSESDGRSSVWRTLSKHARNPTAGDIPSLSRASVGRTRSVDHGIIAGPNKLRRPGSRDRPPIAGAFDDAFSALSRPTSSQRLETIGEPEHEGNSAKAARRKRRSSLSDLKTLMAAATLGDDEPLQPLTNMKQTAERFNSTPRPPSPSKIPISPNSLRLKDAQAESTVSPRQKENFGDLFRAEPPPARESPRKGHFKTLSTSQIPTLKPARSTTGDSPGSPPRPSTSPSRPTARLKLQSPQKLRERLQVEKKALEDVDAQLQSELSKISADMAKVNTVASKSTTVDIRKLSASVQSMQERFPQMLSEATGRHTRLQQDMDLLLHASDLKVKEIDQLFKESTAENELLYEKLNSELGKIARLLKSKQREDQAELVKCMKEAGEETSRVKKENARLRREIASLRAAAKASNFGGDA
ncbi:RhoGEF domain-containing protein [Microdochium trichocladiopsis]|uniref:RhoGEF domain-containing protein n=1 Tax=Microdochium trichocladiopsis TaxID=1682393 RepID=A0A9P9BTD9_9PEZI|nr:RhoGEF domain-containing protein [Microdochium trichocladiopsis]KAH7035519.1 RhoGEF domain-containing protein [Microdochium trichocladiopsis]